jgi:hypothetical protein
VTGRAAHVTGYGIGAPGKTVALVRLKGASMYIGVGAIVLILAIVLLLMFFRGRTTV